MKKILLLLVAIALTACGEPNPFETVETLAANPEKLKELREQCKADRAKVGEELCNRVAEATNRRFIGDGTVPYTPPKEQPKF